MSEIQVEMMVFSYNRNKSAHLSLALLSLTITTCCVLWMQTTLLKAQNASSAPPATSQNTRPAPPYRQAFVSKFKEMMTGLNNSECIGPAKGNRVAFLGISPFNIHLSEFVRKSLNTQALEQLNNDLGFAFRFDSTQNLGLAAKLNSNTPTGQANLGQTIDALLNTSPYVLFMQTTRPRKDVVQIKIDLLARGRNSITRCSKSAELFVLLSSYTVLDAAHIDARENRNFIQSKWIYPYVFEQFSRDITSFKRLRVINKFAMSGACELRNNAARQFRDSYFHFGRNTAQRFNINQSDWPRLRLEKATDNPSPDKLKVKKDDGILYLRYALSDIDRDVVNVSLELYANGDVINSTHINMLIDPRNVSGCSKPGQDPLVELINTANRKGLGFTVRSKKPSFQVGKDHIEFVLTANQPLYFHCLSIGSDGTSKLAFPWEKSQLDKPWFSGEQRTYPQDFNLRSIILQQEARELFGCYASPTRLPRQLEDRWFAAHPFNATGKTGDGSLSYEETRQFLGWLNSTPNTGSAFTWLHVTR